MKLLIVALIRNEAADLSFLGVSLASEGNIHVCWPEFEGEWSYFGKKRVGHCVCMLGPRFVTVYVCYSRLTTLTTYMYVDLVLTYILTDVDMVRADILGWSVCMYVPSNKMNRLSWTYILETLFWLLGSSVSMYVTSNKMTRLPRAYILKNIVFLVFLVCYGFSRLYVSPWREMKLLWKSSPVMLNIPGRWRTYPEGERMLE